MPSYSKVVIVGHLCRDVELKYTRTSTAVAEVSVAVNEKRKDASGNVIEEVSFIDCTLWGRTAEVAHQYTHKGAAVLIEGRLKQDKWDDRETGAKRSKLKVIAERLVMLGSKGDGQSPQSQQSHTQESYDEPSQEMPPTPAGTDDDIPF